ncbi:MAG: type II CRISPR-associated endonuclease Cas1 [Verrucomicrobiota bacterium]
MSYHIITIDSPNCSITVNRGQLTCSSIEDGSKSLPIEDVAAIIVTSFSAKLHSNLLVESAKHGVALVICDRFNPVSLLLPANRSSDTLLTKAELELDKKKKGSLWRKTIDAKCQNQYALAEFLVPEFEKMDRLRAEAMGRAQHKESTCAQYYWRAWGQAIGDVEFKRHSPLNSSNKLLNYGYAVLLSSVLQKLFACGLDPTFGISHAIRERSTPLAYDLMEQFRPCVDWRVAQWMIDYCEPGEEVEITREFKRWVTGFVLETVGYFKIEMTINNCIESVIRSFRNAVLKQSVREYKPWTPPNLKWAG